jgi:hypothetical protein
MSPLVVTIDAIRTLSHTGISGSYAVVGSVFAFPVKLICFTNNTDGDVFFSDDGSTDMLFVAATSFKLFDFTTNRNALQPVWALPTGTQFYVKQSTAPSKGAVYIECLG